MGAAGDMLTAALLELMPDAQEAVRRLNGLGIQNIETKAKKVQKCGITGTYVQVVVNGMEEEEHMHNLEEHHDEHLHEEHHHDHHHEGHHHDHLHEEHHHEHHGFSEICEQIDKLNMSERVKKDAKAVYQIIAEAEGKVHDRPIQDIHFHEVGTKDALADITAVCYLLNELHIDRIVCSPIHVGSGHVHCAHGILPVPAPATAQILQGTPTYSNGVIQGELCTPTGAALIKYFSDDFGPQPVMKIEKIGYGCGKKDFVQANLVRVMLGETDDGDDTIVELSCNLDDCTPENLAFAMEELLAEGALDVYTVPVTMKKNRQGVLFTCMCRPEDKDKMTKLIFQHTTTLGIREQILNRYTLERRIYEVETLYGKVRVKEASGYGIRRRKAEYEDLARIARENHVSLEQVREYCGKDV